MRPFDYFAPETLDEAISILRRRGDGGRLLAGGTDLVVRMKEGGLRPPYVVSLRKLSELRGIEFSEAEGLRIGAMTDMATIASSPIIRERFPILADGAALVGSVQTRNMATVGGNLCNAAPSADMAPPLLAVDAVARIAGAQGWRDVPLQEFFLAPGETVLQNGDILVELRVPTPPRGSGGFYLRHTPRQEMDIAVVGVGALVTLPNGDIEQARVALGAVAPVPMRAHQAEAVLAGKPVSDEVIARAAAIASQEAQPISDVRGSAAFRRELVRVLTERSLRGAVERAGASAP
ncbi:MAG: FAD binding domain-containing protein [Chloroflexota bacterium]|nr:FAD binding domain-containing protein [Chloroflexota bacterium]